MTMTTTDINNDSKTSSTITPCKGISEETSKRICDHMNEDHAVSVYAMVKYQKDFKPPPGWKITTTTLIKVAMDGATINVTLCQGENACRQEQIIYPFIPPLTEPNQIRSRMVSIHHQTCMPIHCYNHTLFPTIVVFYLTTMYYFTLTWQKQHEPHTIVATDPTLFKTMHDCFILMTMAHTGMAMYGTYLASYVLKLKRRGLLNWCIAIFVSGWLGMKELLQLVNVHKISKRTVKEE